MSNKIGSILLIEDDDDLREELARFLGRKGYQVKTLSSCSEVEASLQAERPDAVISDVHMPGCSGIRLLEKLRSDGVEVPPWIFFSGDGSPEMVETACKLGAIDVIQKPFRFETIQNSLRKIEERSESPLHELMDIVQAISGIQLGREKKLLVETRLLRRARLLGMDSVEEYMKFFRENRNSETRELVSLITTHTTEFFREPDHFNFLFDQVFPLLLEKKSGIKFWSAASSSGQELYSIAIAWLEFLRERKIPLASAPKAEFFGSDIDFSSVEKANEGIYDSDAIATISPELIERYFDLGSGDLSGFARVKDEVHRLCRFEQANLLSKTLPIQDADVVFLRNVLIYFKPEDVQKIVVQLQKAMSREGVLFLGHSESLSGLETSFFSIGNSVYQSQKSTRLEIVENKSAHPIRVMVVDDSATIRKMLKKILVPEHGFEVVAEAAHPLEAEEKLRTLTPDLMTLDIHMPEMDGVTYLEKLKKDHREFPVVMVSSINYDDAIRGLRCFELGAIDYIEKPQGLNLESEAERIRAVLKGASKVKRRDFTSGGSKPSGEVAYQTRPMVKDLILIGASTGGVEAIRDVLVEFPKDCPPILIVQHIPPIFSGTFAKRLNDICRIEVVEATHGTRVHGSTAYIAPGGKQMRVRRTGEHLTIEITDEARVNRHKPSVDFLFRSIVEQKVHEHWKVVAALLTGMGEDGAVGLRELKDRGVHTIAQNEETCVVFGMPKAAIDRGGVTEILPLPSIPYHIFRAFKGRAVAA